MSFGIIFYYISHLVESSFIPIRDLMFEHRTYLPNGGLCLVSGWLILTLFEQKEWSRRSLPVVCAGLLIGLGTLAWQRNEVWRDPIRLWHDSAIHAPGKERPWNEYGKHLLQQGKAEEAVTVFQETVDRIHGKDALPGLVMEETAAVNLVIALEQAGNPQAALQVADDFLTRESKAINRSKILSNKGNLLVRQGRLDEAEKNYREAIRSFKKDLTPMNNLAILMMAQGRLDEAEVMLETVLSIDPQFKVSLDLLGRLRQMKAGAGHLKGLRK